jgi:hypothetical protein
MTGEQRETKLTLLQWLVSRTELATVDPRCAYAARPGGYATYRPENYNMTAMPPPIYDPNAARPPMYEGPDGASKVDPSQGRDHLGYGQGAEGQEQGISAPPGPPPSHMAR